MITVKYGNPKNLSNIKQSIFVTFNYKKSIVDSIRTIYCRYYSDKVWELPYDCLDELQELLPNEEFNIIGKPINNKKYNDKVISHDISLPKSLKTNLYSYQKDTFDEGMSFNKYILNLDCGLGKAQPLTSKVLTPDGYINMGDVKAGTLVIGDDGKSHRVLSIHPQGKLTVYKITMSDGSSCRCSGEHLWSVNDTILTTEQMLKDFKPDKYRLPRIKLIDFKHKDVETYVLSNSIPDEYKYNSLDVRYSVLETIISYGKRAEDCSVFSTKNINLVKDIRFVIKSMGYSCFVRKKDKLGYYKIIIFTNKKYGSESIYKIEYDGEEECQCIYVDSDSHLYITDECIPTHNTVSSLAIVKKRMELGQIKRCLIVPCVATLKYNWQNEINQHLGENAKVLGNRKNGKGVWSVKSNADKLADLKTLDKNDKWVITNIESFRDKKITDTLKKLLDKKEIDCIIVDEIHRCANPSSQQGRALLTLSKHCEYMLLLTGTILMNKPTDLYVPLKVVGAEESNFTQFKSRYCVMGGYGNYQVVGYRHLDDLQHKLKQVSKRLKKETVLKELPSKIFIDEYVDMGKEQEKIYTNVLNDIMSNIDNIILSPNPLAQMIRLRQATADTSILSSTINVSAKFDRAKELIADIVDSGESVIVFSNWETVINNFKKSLDKFYKCAIITGKVVDREGEIAKFNEDGCNVILMTIGAGGTGLTLNKASHIIMLDEPWTATNLEQCTSRCHRLGQTKSVNVYTLMCKQTIDEQIHKIVKRKGAMGDAIVDHKLDLKSPAVINYLLTGEGDKYK